MNSVLLLILFVCFLWFLRIRIQCQYTLFSYVASYNISTLCCKGVLEWPQPNATNDEANKWGDLVYGVPEAFKKHQQTKNKNIGVDTQVCSKTTIIQTRALHALFT